MGRGAQHAHRSDHDGSEARLQIIFCAYCIAALYALLYYWGVEILHMEHCLGSNQRFRIPYLRSLAALTAWEGRTEQAIDHLHEAIQLATTIGLPGEQWQIQAALGKVYETAGEQAQARAAFEEATRIIEELADGIKDETLRSRFLAGSQISPVLQHARYLASSMQTDPAAPSGL